MIDDPLPPNWRTLQDNVGRLFRNIGLDATTEVPTATPRGNVTIDVVAIDRGSVDQIKYFVECKSWGKRVPQSVVHSFVHVMQESGANIGFIVSKHGLQSGAKQFTAHTNVAGLTFLELQHRYFPIWWKRYFCPLVGDAADRLWKYVEDFNTVRDEKRAELPAAKQAKFDELRARHYAAGFIFSMFNMPSVSPLFDANPVLTVPESVDAFKQQVLAKALPGVVWNSKTTGTFRGMLNGLLCYLNDAELEFNELFGCYIFGEEAGLSGVSIEGPPLPDC
ncbi:restriction endonuclease [Acidovorax delafieldii]|uniref:restriction endonuclease n=1 Tax=Acidovorax delafieldii TaxID=47920 RepID=UPI003ECD42D1